MPNQKDDVVDFYLLKDMAKLLTTKIETVTNDIQKKINLIEKESNNINNKDLKEKWNELLIGYETNHRELDDVAIKVKEGIKNAKFDSFITADENRSNKSYQKLDRNLYDIQTATENLQTKLNNLLPQMQLKSDKQSIPRQPVSRVEDSQQPPKPRSFK